MPVHFKDRCADILITVAPLFPVAAMRAAAGVLQDSGGPSTSTAAARAAAALPPGLHFKLVEAAVACAVGAVRQNYHAAPQLVAEAVKALAAPHGVLGWRRLHSGHLSFVLRQAHSLVCALTAPHGLATGAEALTAVVDLVQACMDKAAAALSTPCSLRIALGRAVGRAFSHATALFPEPRLGQAIDLVVGLATDTCYAGRLVGGTLVSQMLNKFDDPTVRWAGGVICYYGGGGGGGATRHGTFHADAGSSPPVQNGFAELKSEVKLSSNNNAIGNFEGLETAILMLGRWILCSAFSISLLYGAAMAHHASLPCICTAY